MSMKCANARSACPESREWPPPRRRTACALLLALAALPCGACSRGRRAADRGRVRRRFGDRPHYLDGWLAVRRRAERSCPDGRAPPDDAERERDCEAGRPSAASCVPSAGERAMITLGTTESRATITTSAIFVQNGLTVSGVGFQIPRSQSPDGQDDDSRDDLAAFSFVGHIIGHRARPHTCRALYFPFAPR